VCVCVCVCVFVRARLRACSGETVCCSRTRARAYAQKRTHRLASLRSRDFVSLDASASVVRGANPRVGSASSTPSSSSALRSPPLSSRNQSSGRGLAMAACLRSWSSHMAVSQGSGSGVITGSRSTTAAAMMRLGGAVHCGIWYSGFLRAR